MFRPLAQLMADFNPRPPRGGRLLNKRLKSIIFHISIHAPREGGDNFKAFIQWAYAHFNPRPPRGGRHRGAVLVWIPKTYFNPRPPRGGRLWQSAETPDSINIFQSTPPARGATHPCPHSPAKQSFQSTPPARGATWKRPSRIILDLFQSTPPARGATRAFLYAPARHQIFQSTPPARGATLTLYKRGSLSLFQSTPPARGATIAHYIRF